MRVLHVYRMYFPDPPGGLQEAVRQLALATRPHGVESRIFTLSPTPSPPRLEVPEGEVVRQKSWAAPASCDLGGPGAFREFAAQVRWADVVHYQFPWPFADLLHFARRPDKPCVLTYQSDVVRKGWLGRLYIPLMRRMLASMDAVVATSPAYLETSPYLQSLVAPERRHVIPLGICEPSYQEAVEGARAIEVCQRFGLSGPGYFLFLGALRGYKGLDVLADAVRGTDIPVVIAGDGALASEVRALTAASPNVKWLGHVSDAEKMALLEACRSLVLPSSMRSEAFGMVQVEAQMCARPVISTELGTGTTYVNEAGVTGLVVPPNDADALRDAMHALLADPERAATMGRAGRARYETMFSGQALGRSYADLYRRLLADA